MEHAAWMPHGYCFNWHPGVLGLHLVGDTAIALAYFLIPLTFYAFAREARLPAALEVLLNWIIDRRTRPPEMNWFLRWFAIFTLLCGITHVMNMWELYAPIYVWSGLAKLVTAGVSLWTARRMVPVFYLMQQSLKRTE